MLHNPGVTEKLAQLVLATRWEDLPPPVAHQAGVLEKLHDLSRRVSSDLGGVESVERLPVVVALLQDRVPTQPGLRALQNQKFEELVSRVKGKKPEGVQATEGVEGVGAGSDGVTGTSGVPWSDGVAPPQSRAVGGS